MLLIELPVVLLRCGEVVIHCQVSGSQGVANEEARGRWAAATVEFQDSVEMLQAGAGPGALKQ